MSKSRFIVFLLVLISFPLAAQLYNPLNPFGVGGGNDSRNRYDYEQFLLQQKQSENLIGLDTVDVIKKEIQTTPEELRKLGVDEKLIAELMSLNAFSDSLSILGLKVEQSRKIGEDTLSIQDLQEIIQFQKDELIRKALSLPIAEIYGQSYFRNNVVKLFDEQIINNKPSENYILGSGDEISINIWGRNDVSEKHVISETGEISPKIVGNINLKGISFKNAKELIINRYEKAYGASENSIEVSLNFNRLVSVNIVGEIFNPGTYTFSSANSAFNALVAIDGPNEIGTLRNIFIKRNGQVVKQLDVYNYLLDPGADTDFFLENNDYIFIPPQENIVIIDGAVRRPFKYEMKKGETLQDLIKFAGGLTETAHKEHIGLRRYENNEELYFEINLDSLSKNQKNFQIQNGDSIYVKKINPVRSNVIQVDGAVRVPGGYILRDGDRIADVLFRAGGPARKAELDKGFLFRTNDNRTREVITYTISEILVNQQSNGNVLLEPNDSLLILSRDSIRQEFPVYINGEVRNPGEYQFGENLKLHDLIMLAGNLNTEASSSQIEVTRVMDLSSESPEKGERIVVKRANILASLGLDNEDGDFLLRPFDRVFIRRSPNFEIQQNVVLLGEVMYPGEYSLINKSENVHSLIKRAGGFTQYAFKSASKLNRIEDGQLFLDLKDVFDDPNKSSYNYILSDRDTIIVPKMTNFVSLKGEIKYFSIDTLTDIINVPYEAGRKADYYVKTYGGGFGKYGKKAGTFVQHPNGEIHRSTNFLVFRSFPKVENGSTIIVDETDRKKFEAERRKRKKERKFDWNRAIDSIASAMITVLTVAILYFQIRSS